MARVYGITLPAGLEVVYNKTLKMYDISVNCNIGKNRRFMTRTRLLNLREFSKLTDVAYAWHALSEEEKAAWYSAADAQGTNGYSLWTQDKIYRLQNSIPGNATPSIYHQYLVGHIKHDGLAIASEFTQYHNHGYVRPATLKISYKSDLVAAGPDPYAILRLRTMSYYTGKNIYVNEDINLNLSQGWTTANETIGVKSGVIGNFRLILKLNDVLGDLYFDNIFFEYGGQNESNDPFCDDVRKYWYEKTQPEGCDFESIYPLGGAL